MSCDGSDAGDVGGRRLQVSAAYGRGGGRRQVAVDPVDEVLQREGTPPGRWLGAGVAGLGGGRIAEGDQVSEAQLQLLVGMGRDPITGVPLGRAYPEYQPVAERVADLDPGLGPVGVEWEAREMGRNRNPAWAIAGVPEELVTEFFTRSRYIDAETNRLIGHYVEAYGRRLSPATIMKLRAQAPLSTRPEKEVDSLADLTAGWRARAGRVLGTDATAWARKVAANEDPLLLSAMTCRWT